MDILGLMFPKKCVGCKLLGSYLCPSCFVQIDFDVRQNCFVCKKQNSDGMTHPRCLGKDTPDGVVSAVVYKTMMKRLLSQFTNKSYVSDLRTVLGELFYESLIQKEAFITMLEKNSVIITALPLARKELRQRGYNQGELLAQDLSKRLKLSYRSLVSLKNIQGKTILIVTDVMVSKSAISEAARILKEKGATFVYGVVLANT